MMTDQFSVSTEKLYRRLDPSTLPFESTREVAPLDGTIGQPRAIDAIQMAASFRSPGFNLYVAGRSGSGRKSTVRDFIQRYAKEQPTPDDWVYVNNFSDGNQPVSLQLPPGMGRKLVSSMAEFIRFARREIPKAFETENYENRLKLAVNGIPERRKNLIEELIAFAKDRDVAIEVSTSGFISVPLMKGKPIPKDKFQGLSEDEKNQISLRTNEVEEKSAGLLIVLRSLDKEERERVRHVDREIVKLILGAAFEEMKEQFKTHATVLQYLDQAQEDLLDHLIFFRSSHALELDMESKLSRENQLMRYQVNLLVDNGETKGAPVVFERNPTYYNLFGRISYRATLGMMTTDLLEISCGAIHRANGGFIVLDAVDVLRNPFSWETLKRVLLSGKAQIENLGEQTPRY